MTLLPSNPAQAYLGLAEDFAKAESSRVVLAKHLLCALLGERSDDGEEAQEIRNVLQDSLSPDYTLEDLIDAAHGIKQSILEADEEPQYGATVESVLVIASNLAFEQGAEMISAQHLLAGLIVHGEHDYNLAHDVITKHCNAELLRSELSLPRATSDLLPAKEETPPLLSLV